MIISYEHEMVFLHSRKTAGSSVNVYLNRFLGPQDIQLGCWHASKNAGGSYNRRFLKDVAKFNKGRSLLRKLLGKVTKGKKLNLQEIQVKAYKQHFKDPIHASANEVRNYMGRDFDKFFKFSFVRNPYDKVLSDFRWRHRRIGLKEPVISLKEYLLRLQDADRPDPEGLRPNMPLNWPIYTIDDEVVVDFLGRYENLIPDIEHAFEQVGIPFDSKAFPHEKSGGMGNRNYRAAYGPEERKIVESLYGNELQEFGYEF